MLSSVLGLMLGALTGGSSKTTEIVFCVIPVRARMDLNIPRSYPLDKSGGDVPHVI